MGQLNRDDRSLVYESSQYLTSRLIFGEVKHHAASLRRRQRREQARKNSNEEELEAEMNFSSFSISSAESLNCFYEFRKLHSFLVLTTFAQQFQ